MWQKSLNSCMSVSLWQTNVTVKWHHDDVFNHFSMNYDISSSFFSQNWPLRPHAMLIHFSRLTRWTELLLLNMDVFLNNNKNKNNSNKCWFILFWNTCIQNPLPRLVRFIGMLMQYISQHNEFFHRTLKKRRLTL